MFGEAIEGDMFYSLKYRQWFTIETVDTHGIMAMVSMNCPKHWNFEGYLLADDIYGCPDARWVEPDFKEVENVRPKRKQTRRAEGEAFVNIYPKDGKEKELAESFHTEEGEILCIHPNHGRAKQVLEQGGKTYSAKYYITYEVEI